MTEKEKCLSKMRREIALANEIPWPTGCGNGDEEKATLIINAHIMRQNGETIRGVDFSREMFAELALGDRPEDQLLFGRTDWNPSVNAVLSLLSADILTVGDLCQIGISEMKTTYGLEEEDARQLKELLNHLGIFIRQPRVRKIYDHWKKAPK